MLGRSRLVILMHPAVSLAAIGGGRDVLFEHTP